MVEGNSNRISVFKTDRTFSHHCGGAPSTNGENMQEDRRDEECPLKTTKKSA